MKNKIIIWITAMILLVGVVYGVRLCWEGGEYYAWRSMPNADYSETYGGCCIDMEIWEREGYFECENPYQCLEQGSSTYEYQCGYGGDIPKYASNPINVRNAIDPSTGLTKLPIEGTVTYDLYCTFFSPPETPNVDTACDLDEMTMMYEPRDPCPDTGCDFMEEIPNEDGSGTIPNPDYCNCFFVDSCGIDGDSDGDILDLGEECDGSDEPCLNGTFCSVGCECVEPICGNGIIEPGELCETDQDCIDLGIYGTCVNCTDCITAGDENDPPGINGNSLGPIYGDSNQGFGINRFPDPKPNEDMQFNEILIGLGRITDLDKRTHLKITDDHSNLVMYFINGKEGLNYKPGVELKIEELPKPISFELKVKDGGEPTGEVKSAESGISALLCPDKINLINSAYLKGKIENGGLWGKMKLTITRAIFHFNKGDCYPEIEIVVEFKSMNDVVMNKILKKSEAFKGFDVKIGEEFSLLEKVKQLIIEKEMNGRFTKTDMTFVIKTYMDNTKNLVGEVKIDGYVDKLLGDSEIKLQYIYSGITCEKASEMINNLFDSFKDAEIDQSKLGTEEGEKKEENSMMGVYNIPTFNTYDEAVKGGAEKIRGFANPFAWEWYWYYTDKTKEGNIEYYKQKLKEGNWLHEHTLNLYPLKVSTQAARLEGASAIKWIYFIFDYKAIEYTKSTGKPYLEYHVKPPAYKSYYGFLGSTEDSHLDVYVKKKEISGEYLFDSTSYNIESDWELTTDIEIDRIYNFKEYITSCCPLINDKINEFKDKWEAKDKENSIYYLFESNKSLNYETIAYQFSPPYIFENEVIKYFDLILFNDPVYFKAKDSLLDGCEFEILDEAYNLINSSGGNLTLPDEIFKVDKVGEVKQIFPEDAVLWETNFSIKRIRIFNCTCYNGVQDVNEIGVDCGGVCEPCVETCYDNIQNQDEMGIDVGGICIIPAISDSEESCEDDINRNGITRDCIACEDDNDCLNYVCGESLPICQTRVCYCSRFAKIENYNGAVDILKESLEKKYWLDDGISSIYYWIAR